MIPKFTVNTLFILSFIRQLVCLEKGGTVIPRGSQAKVRATITWRETFYFRSNYIVKHNGLKVPPDSKSIYILSILRGHKIMFNHNVFYL